MTNTFRMLMLTGALAGAFAVSTGAAAKEITVALASTFTTMDPYDAGDTLSLGQVNVRRAFWSRQGHEA